MPKKLERPHFARTISCFYQSEPICEIEKKRNILNSSNAAFHSRFVLRPECDREGGDTKDDLITSASLFEDNILALLLFVQGLRTVCRCEVLHARIYCMRFSLRINYGPRLNVTARAAVATPTTKMV